MTRNFIKKHKFSSLLWILLFGIKISAQAQSAPEIPSSVSFGGISVKFDRDAQNLIEEDVKNLMSNKKFWEEKMERAILFFPIVEGILMDEEVPIDFKYLAVQESSFRPDVVSSSNAVGYWQFKPETARELNLRVDDEVDERKNISSSTHAAAWYLKRNNQQFNNWVSTLYSYYQGAGGVKKIVPSNWSYAREVTLNGKTDRYMLRFFAHKIALEAGLERFKSSNKIVLFESEYGKGQSFEEIGRSLGVSSKDLENYNKWVTNGRVPSDREYLITVPVLLDQVSAVREKLSLPPQPTSVATAYAETGFPVLKKSDVQSTDKGAPVFYDINGLPGIEARPGDSPKQLAKAGKVRRGKFTKYNDMLRDMPLIPGNVYYLARKNRKAATPFHTARPGDTWQTVSQQYGLRLVSLLKYNRTISRNYPIQAGQVLWLTKKRPKNQPIEIITPKISSPAPAEAVKDVIASAANAASGSNAIPDKPSGRKKYTPVLVEKSESSIAKENQDFQPGVTPKVIPAVVAKPTEPSKETNDRVVIITQDSSEESFRSVDEKASSVEENISANVPAKPATSASTTGSVYARQQREAAEKAAAEKEIAAKAPVKVPVTKSTPEPEVKKAPIAAAPVEATEGFHVVQSGDTYFSISRKYSMPVNDLLKLNNRDGRNSLSVGQKLRVRSGGSIAGNYSTKPTSGTNIEKEAEKIVKEREDRNKTGVEFHTVEVGQTYFGIAKMYGLTINELLNLNNLTGADRLKSGQELRVRKNSGTISAVAPETRQPSNLSQTHIVASGETLFRISQNYGTSVEELKRMNNISGNSVSVGQKLKVPQK